MIYTLTLNPAIDQMISLSKFSLGQTNKVKEQYQVLGGKGINVSVMLKTLGYDNIALGFMAKNESLQFENYLKSKNIASNFHQIKGQTRLNLKIRDLSNNQETELNCLGFTINENDESAIIALVKKHLTKEDLLIISGSIALGSTKNLYQEIAQYCFENKIIFAIDTSKNDLLATLKYQPLLVKPNLAELNEIFNTAYDFDDLDQIVKLAKDLLSQGAKNVLISNGNKGSLLVTKNHSYLANAASGKLINSVGAGDSMVAAFVATYNKTKDEKTSLLLASAAGSSTAFSQGIGDLSLIEELKKQIKIILLE